MAVIVDNDTKLVVQGLTGSEGRFHGLRNRNYGTDVVAGVTPGKGGQDVDGIPVFDTVADAVAEAGANTSLIFVPARFAADAIYEAVDAGLEVEQVQLFEKTHDLDEWLARTGCVGDEARRVRELLSELIVEGGRAWRDTKIVLKARKSQR